MSIPMTRRSFLSAASIVVPQPANGESGASEDRVIVRIGIERRIEADKVNAFVRKVCHDVEAVAVVEGVGGKADVHI